MLIQEPLYLRNDKLAFGSARDSGSPDTFLERIETGFMMRFQRGDATGHRLHKCACSLISGGLFVNLVRERPLLVMERPPVLLLRSSEAFDSFTQGGNLIGYVRYFPISHSSLAVQLRES